MAKHLLGWSPGLLGHVSQQNNVFLLPPFTSVLEQTAQSFLHSHHVPELGAVCCSNSLLHCQIWASSLSGHFVSNVSCQSFCHFLTELRWDKVRNLAYCRFILYRFFTYISVIFSGYFFRQICTKI
jgi:hypothetical protein